MSPKLILALSCAIVSIAPAPVRAGASLYVDDASVTARGHCQVQSWVRGYAPGVEFSSVPACNIGGTEFALGLSHFDQPSSRSLVSLGVKRAFHDLDAHRWGIAASIGANCDGASGRLEGWNANIPVSVALDADRSTVVHVDAGWSKPRSSKGRVTRGIGVEQRLGANWTLLGEAHADRATIVQIGLRRAFGDNASLDLLAGRQGGAAPSSWLALGFNIAFAD